MTVEQFKEVGSILRQGMAEAGYKGKLIFQGSRAAGTASKDSDYDIALVVSPEEFDRILYEKSKFAKHNLSNSDKKVSIIP